MIPLILSEASYSSGEASGQGHLQVSFESDQCRHQDEHLGNHLEHLPVLEHTEETGLHQHKKHFIYNFTQLQLKCQLHLHRQTL